MTRADKQRRAFTIIELLLASALAAMLLGAAAVGLSTLSNGVRINDSSLRARQSGTRTLEFILGKVRRARKVDLLPVEPVDGVYTSLATLDDAVWDASDWSTTGRKYTYFTVSGGTLYAGPTDNIAEAAPLLRNVSSVVFRSPMTGSPLKHRHVSVEITLTAPDATGGAQNSQFTIAGDAAIRCEE